MRSGVKQPPLRILGESPRCTANGPTRTCDGVYARLPGSLSSVAPCRQVGVDALVDGRVDEEG